MRSKILETLFLLFFDIIAIIGVFSLSYYLRLGTFSHSVFPFQPYFTMSLVMVPIFIIFLIFSGRYSLKEKSLWNHFKHIISASLAGSLLFPLLFYFSEEQFFSRGIILLIFIFSLLSLFTLSYIFQKIRKFKSEKNIGISKMLVIGAGRNAQKIITTLIQTQSAHKPVAILTPYGSKKKEISGVKIFGKLDSLEKIFISEDINEVFLCEAVEHSENLASFCRNKGVILRTSLETLGINHHAIETETIENTTFLTLQQSPLFGWGQFFKRLFDIIFSLFGLIIFSPYFLYNRKYITITKFSNGKETTFAGITFQKDKKIYGKNISLLWNILKKDISFIGPKVMTKTIYDEFFKEIKEQSESRYILRPGLFSSYNKTNNTPESIIRSDILYIRNWSFWNDMKIFWKNIF